MTISKGEIWLVNLDPTVGDEIRKMRPAIVVNRDALGVLALRVVVPVTAWQDRFQGCDWLVPLDPDASNKLDKPSTADTFQVRSVSTRRFVRCLGHLSEADMERVGEGLRAVFEL
ncbi:MAG TPA: type II toxin-antitoxin system PemK/MazF family toxin [Candidatus Anammoximicrobium sp.]|nr:type II toxin-antitoxin system PemK/MazF family toxin [Candidatus Anammoximicrobium sp.]